MEQKLENKLALKEKLSNFYNANRSRIYSTVFILIMGALFLVFLNYYNEKKNNIIAEKYIQAGIFLNLEKKDDARQIYEEIILSKNKFYSILSLNNLIEKKLVLDDKKILSYFNILENKISNKETKDLIIFKKALFLKKNLKIKEGEDLLKNLIENNSNLKLLAQEIIKK